LVESTGKIGSDITLQLGEDWQTQAVDSNWLRLINQFFY
jgi:hypothetical protein